MGLVGQVGYSISPALLKEFATNERNFFHFSTGENLILKVVALECVSIHLKDAVELLYNSPLNWDYTIQVTVVDYTIQVTVVSC